MWLLPKSFDQLCDVYEPTECEPCDKNGSPPNWSGVCPKMLSLVARQYAHVCDAVTVSRAPHLKHSSRVAWTAPRAPRQEQCGASLCDHQCPFSTQDDASQTYEPEVHIIPDTIIGKAAAKAAAALQLEAADRSDRWLGPTEALPSAHARFVPAPAGSSTAVEGRPNATDKDSIRMSAQQGTNMTHQQMADAVARRISERLAQDDQQGQGQQDQGVQGQGSQGWPAQEQVAQVPYVRGQAAQSQVADVARTHRRAKKSSMQTKKKRRALLNTSAARQSAIAPSE